MITLRQKGSKLYRIATTVFATLILLGVAGTTLAQVDAKYTPLVGIPGITNNESTTLPDYINAIYIVLITVGALWGVIKIVFAGVKYSLSDIVTDKSDAKDDIKGVLLGLILLLLPWVILNEIYPNLTNLNILQPGAEQNTPLQQAQNLNIRDQRRFEELSAGDGICVGKLQAKCEAGCVKNGGKIIPPADPNASTASTCDVPPFR